MKTYQYILLDWDGNLAKTLDVWLEACRIPLEGRGLKLTDAEIAASFGEFEKNIEKWGFPDEVDQISDEADEIAALKLPYLHFIPMRLKCLADLRVLEKTPH